MSDKEIEKEVAEKAEPKPKSVSVKQFEEFQTQVTGALSAITEALQNRPAVEAAPVVSEEGGPDDQTPIPPSWKKAVATILGPDFACEIVQPDAGGTLFKIIVPREKSNAQQMHWEMHTRDVRTKEIGNTGLPGVEEWCKRVRANLQKTGAQLIQYP